MSSVTRKALNVLITGAEGGVGQALCKELTKKGHTVTGVTFKDSAILNVKKHIVADLRDRMKLKGMFIGQDAVIHLAALPKPWETWPAIYQNNVLMDGNVFEELVEQRSTVKTRLIYASTCHTQHGSSMKTTHETLKDDEYGRHLPNGKVLKLDETHWPSSPYGAAKLLGEHLGRFYALQNGLEVFALRLGWLIPEDDPRAVGEKEQGFMRGLYLSHRDAGNIFQNAMTLPLGTPPFAVAYATSNNGRSYLDVEPSFKTLQYTSQDDAESFY